VIELLAITDDPAPPPPPLSVVRSGGLSAVCAPAPDAEDRTVDALWRREELLERLMRDRDLLPVRFGTVVRDEDGAMRAIEARRDELTARLDRVRGAVELALRVEPVEAGAVRAEAHASGRAYLQAKAGGARAAAQLHEPLAELAREAVVQPGRELLRAAYLVDRGAVEAFVARVRELQRAHEDLAIVCTGPWPPFSFAEEASRR
jgi:hypothetical protein